jgi:hypothetical protein
MAYVRLGMIQKSQTYNVFLDTEVFDGHQYDFNTPDFKTLIAHVSKGIMRVYMTDVTKREIERHIHQKASEIFAQLERLRKFPIVRNLKHHPFDSLAIAITAQEVEEELLSQFHSFCDAIKLQVLLVEGIDIVGVINDYFEQKSPFGTGKKKAEFPDAIAAYALKKWCMENSQEMYVVTGDPDWKGVCGPSTPLVYKEKLAEVLTEVLDLKTAEAIFIGFQERSEEIEELVKQEFLELGFSTYNVDGEVEDVRVLSIGFIEVYIIDAKDGNALLEVQCEITFEADVTYENYSNSPYDNEEKAYLWSETINTSVDHTTKKTVNIELTYLEDSPEELEIQSIVFEGGDISVFVDELDNL